jgi:diguanylate cyclase (GGDEF)-like protein
MLSHSSAHLKEKNLKMNKVWKIILILAILTQTFDIISYFINGVDGVLAYNLSYIFNILLFTFEIMLGLQFAIFIEYTANSSSKFNKALKIIFITSTVIGVILCLLTIPFGLIFYINEFNEYSRGSFYYLLQGLVFLPPTTVFIRLIFKYANTVNKFLKNNLKIALLMSLTMFAVMLFTILQGFVTMPFTIIIPILVVGMLVMYLMLLSNTITIDHLTTMQNNFGLESYFNQMPSIATSDLAVIFFDIDKLKVVNDTKGHNMGDKLIKDFATILLNEIKHKDLAVRVGGDEFVLVLGVKDEEDIKGFISNIYEEIKIYNKKNTIQIQYSFGYSYLEKGNKINKEELIEQADKKMYINKNKKKE